MRRRPIPVSCSCHASEVPIAGADLSACTHAAASSGIYTTLLQGVCIGFFVPFLPFFFFRTQLFSTRSVSRLVHDTRTLASPRLTP